MKANTMVSMPNVTDDNRGMTGASACTERDLGPRRHRGGAEDRYTVVKAGTLSNSAIMAAKSGNVRA